MFSHDENLHLSDSMDGAIFTQWSKKVFRSSSSKWTQKKPPARLVCWNLLGNGQPCCRVFSLRSSIPFEETALPLDSPAFGGDAAVTFRVNHGRDTARTSSLFSLWIPGQSRDQGRAKTQLSQRGSDRIQALPNGSP